MKSVFLIFLTLICSASGCARDVTTPYYNRLAYGKIDGLSHDGYIVGVEKIHRNMIDGGPVCNNTRNSCFDENLYQLLPDDSRKNKTRNNRFRQVTNDPKLMIVTHFFRYELDSSSAIYNAYQGYGEDESEATVFTIAESYQSFADMGADLKERISSTSQGENPYTHILVMSMGWNNDQKESILRFNRIVAMLHQERGQRRFKPMVIGVTWPSVWLSGSESWLMRNVGHISSVFNKANDADEVGYTVMADLLYRQILPVKAVLKQNIPVILIGHSYGARLLSRALFGDVHQKNLPACNAEVDMMFGLQPAFSANRFINGNGLEGYPYDNFNKRKTRIILTTSKYDTANPLAFWSRHIGGSFGWNQANDHNQDSSQKIFYTTVWNKDARQFNPPLPDADDSGRHGYVTMVNAESIVRRDSGIGTDGEPLSGHNDILDDEMAQLIWAGIDKLSDDMTLQSDSGKCPTH